MNDKLFKLEALLPPIIEEVTIYSTNKTKDEREKNIDLRFKKLSKIFGVGGKSTDLGDKMHRSEKNKSLSIYQASDSFWYQDDDLFATENKKFSKTLPDKKTAKEAALQFLKTNDLLLPEAEVNTVTYTAVAVNKADTTIIDEYNTEIHINLRYSLDKLPVFGPGAKTRISFVDEKTNSGVYHFWRAPMPLKEKRKIITPELAIEIFSKNFRFAQLKEDASKVIIKEMQLGYYAMSPADVQNFLVPVYRVTGVVNTEAHPTYNFTHYIVAVKYTEDDVKAMGLYIGNVKALVF